MLKNDSDANKRSRAKEHLLSPEIRGTTMVAPAHATERLTAMAALPHSASGDARPPWAGHKPRRPIRRKLIEAGVPYRSTCGTPSNEISYSLAQELTYAPQGPCGVVERCWRSLSYAPVEHLRRLLRDETYILFAPTIVLALDSPWADDRRGQGLTHADRDYYARECSQEAGTAAIYDGWTNALVFPTSYCAADPVLDDIVMHELGHALTWRAAWEDAPTRSDLLVGLPAEIRQHVFSDAYLVRADEVETRRTRVLEALAEGYAWLIANPDAELPPRLTSELLDILSEDEFRASRRLI